MTRTRIANSDRRRQRRHEEGVRWPCWFWLVVGCLMLIILAQWRESDASGQIRTTAQWLLIAALMASAWCFTKRPAVVVTLMTLGIWSWIEVPALNWAEWLPGHLLRVMVGIGGVAWMIHVREQLVTARKLARVDFLTGLPNRQALIEALEAEIGRAKRFNRPYSIALMDCDGFKQINDVRGHLVGDDALRKIGESLRAQARPFDCAGRWGGDEFLIVLSEVDQFDAQTIAERFRAAIRHNVERGHPSLTCSMGVVTVRNVVLDWQECVRRADEAMYIAKRLGRDQTRFEIVEADAV
jgi:diguanylate cyclase (GGDEF)-like protein